MFLFTSLWATHKKTNPVLIKTKQIDKKIQSKIWQLYRNLWQIVSVIFHWEHHKCNKVVKNPPKAQYLESWNLLLVKSAMW